MSKLFGGKNPFDDPFFTEPFGGWFGWNDPFDVQQDSRKQITIEELNPEGDGGQAQENSEPTKDLVVKNKKPSKKSNGSQSFSYRRVSYGGLNGMYYICSEGKMIGPDGVVLAEMKEEDKTIGESLHTISKGIHNKGHSVTTKHSSDGREDTLQTLHNLNEDELGDFEQNWKLMLISICLDGIRISACWRIKGPLAACGMSLQIGGVWVVMKVQLWSTTEMQDRWRKSVCGKNVLIDMSIHTAYVKAIRAAQHFIYIENQYFLGSSYNWSNYQNLGANNLIPMEIALKIANKIRANERFAAYIVLPMWPEGNPTSTPTQRILFWQYNTMQMMYETIYKALQEVGLENTYEPQDYLMFFCLGNREVPENGITTVVRSSKPNTPQELTQKSRRFMIYVHSKGMIVDDEYVIMGSANINQRSLEGTRDTEIAMGAYQPHHTWANKHSGPHAQVYGYRMSLWAEHTGTLEQCFEHPESLECVRRIRVFGEHNWLQYAADEVTEMKGHLLKYPVEVDRTGKVRSLPGCETFPDIGGKIIGTFTGVQENLTI